MKMPLSHDALSLFLKKEGCVESLAVPIINRFTKILSEYLFSQRTNNTVLLQHFVHVDDMGTA